MPLNSSSITKLKLPTFPFINCLTGVRYFKSSGHETALERVGLVKQLANRSSGHWRNDGRKNRTARLRRRWRSHLCTLWRISALRVVVWIGQCQCSL